jgi:hypothetical protein
MSIILVALRYNSELEISKFRLNRVDENLKMWDLGLVLPMMVEMCTHLVINPPLKPEFGIEVL